MSVTFNTMFKRSLRLIGVLGQDRDPTAAEAADGMYSANAMLDAWGIERLMVYQIQQATHTWPASTASRTMGSGGDFAVTRPTKIERGTFFRDSGGNDYPVMVTYDRAIYDSIILKSTGGSTPGLLFVDAAYPLTVLYAYPVPSEALTLHLNTWKQLQSFTSLTDAISMPPGYQDAFEMNLAVWIAPEYGTAAMERAQNIEKRAALLKSNIKSINAPSLVSSLDLAIRVASRDTMHAPLSTYTVSGYLGSAGLYWAGD
jgi:hypothetical protein